MNTTVNNTGTRSRRQRWVKRIQWTATILGAIYFGVLAYLIIFETSLVYPALKYPSGNWQPTKFVFEEVEFRSTDETKIVGWFLPRNRSASTDHESGAATEIAETILLCHGNAENAATAAVLMGNALRETLNADVFVYDYRGYGKSEGIPHEAGILLDSDAALQWLEQKTGKASTEITIVGHSIGGGPGCYLAGKHGAKLLILQRTFNSLANTAQANYPIFPVKYVMQNQYPSSTRILDYDGPVFQSHGTADRLIPIELAKKLFETAPTSNKRFIAIEGMGHFDPLPADYWIELKDFVGKLNVH